MDVRRIIAPGVVGGFVVGTALCAGLAAARPGLRTAAKQELLLADASLTGGWVRRTYHRQRRPTAQMLDVPRAASGAYAWLERESFLPIAHGLGPVLTHGWNQIQTFIEGHRMGFRIFEVDLTLTREGRLACYHGGADEDLDSLTFAAYESDLRRRGGVPCQFEDLVGLSRQHPDVFFVLDVKNRFDEAYAEIRKQLSASDRGRSFIPQVYDFDQLRGFRTQPAFAGEILTSYRSALTTEQILDAARRAGVRAVTLTLERATAPGFRVPSDLAVFTHSVDDLLLAGELRANGFRGIYTSYLSPPTLRAIEGIGRQ